MGGGERKGTCLLLCLIQDPVLLRDVPQALFTHKVIYKALGMRVTLFAVLREAGKQQTLVLAPNTAHAKLLQPLAPGLGGTMDHLKPPTGKTSVLPLQRSQHNLFPGSDPQQALQPST